MTKIITAPVLTLLLAFAGMAATDIAAPQPDQISPLRKGSPNTYAKLPTRSRWS
jgi:hypothetical protein